MPVIGRITAGLPIYAQQEWEESIIVDTELYTGVRKGMAVSRAGRICRDAVITPPSPEFYRRAMKAMFRQVCEFPPLWNPGKLTAIFQQNLWLLY